jgi:chaperonin GroEL
MTVKYWQTPKVIFNPDVYLGMQKGINRLVDSIRPTLGPIPRLVVVESTLGRDKLPELLDNGGVIARRIIQLADRDEDAGAMLLRHMLCELHKRAGDGTATAAVIFQSVFNQGVRFIQAGGDAMRLHFHLERGAQIILDQLEGMKESIHGEEKLTRLAETLCYDADLAHALGEIYARMGEFASLDIRAGRGRELEKEYFRGMYWEGGLISRLMVTNQTEGSTRLENAAVLLSDLEIDNPNDLVPLVEMASTTGLHAVLILANKISERALSLLTSSQIRTRLQILAVKTPGRTIDDQWAALQDISVLTGSQPLYKAAGDRIDMVRPKNLGRASQVYADLEQFGILQRSANSELLQAYIERLKNSFANAENAQVRHKLLERIGKLQGGSAVLWIGATTPLALETRKEKAIRTFEALRWSIRYGVVPGGGVAYLDCCAGLKSRLQQVGCTEEIAAYRILIQALQEPIRAILSNAGIPVGETIGKLELAGPGYGFDVLNHQVVDMAGAGIYDSASVAKGVISCAVRGAALALTTQVLVHRRNPPDGSRTT